MSSAESDWYRAQRLNVGRYLRDQGVEHGEIGAHPAWAVSPYVSVWAVESLAAPGSVGWWAISGDLPTDYCSSAGAGDPRSAVRRIVEGWLAALDQSGPDPALIGTTGLDSSLRELLASRAGLLEEWITDDTLWPAP